MTDGEDNPGSVNKVICSSVGVKCCFPLQCCEAAELNTKSTPKYSALSINVFIIYIFIEQIYSASLNFVIAVVTNNLTIKHNNVWHSAKHHSNLFRLLQTESALRRGPVFPEVIK